MRRLLAFAGLAMQSTRMGGFDGFGAERLVVEKSGLRIVQQSAGSFDEVPGTITVEPALPSGALFSVRIPLEKA